MEEALLLKKYLRAKKYATIMAGEHLADDFAGWLVERYLTGSSPTRALKWYYKDFLRFYYGSRRSDDALTYCRIKPTSEFVFEAPERVFLDDEIERYVKKLVAGKKDLALEFFGKKTLIYHDRLGIGVLVLKYIYGYRNTEISRMFYVSEATIGNLLKTITAKIRLRLTNN